ncbi:DUF2336 domain-containing protein [Breoghania sp. L-A4]|nr:DUF2336 domain-containing protein [Breoghania sp. L-A4]
MPVTQLVELARDRSAKGRTALAKAITEMFFGGGRIPGDVEKRLFGDVVARILDQVADELRAEIIEQIAETEHVDRELVLQLACEDPVVSRPILAKSPLLYDEDLAHIARHHGEEHQLAIASRPVISEAVTDVLSEVGGIDVLRCLVDNRGARFSMFGLGTLLSRGGEDAEIQKNLATRGAEEQAFGGNLQASLTDELRQRLGAFAALVDDGHFEEAAVRAAMLIDAGLKNREERKVQRAALLQTTREGKRSLDSIIAELAMEDRFADCVWLVASILRLEECTVQKALLQSDLSSIIVLCRATGMGMQGFCTFANIACRRLGRSDAEAVGLARDFNRMRQDDARRTLLLIREGQRSELARSRDAVAA